MQLEFTYTLDDWLEANKAHAAASAASARRQPAFVLVLVLCVVIAILIVLLGTARGRSPTPLAKVLTPVIPWMLIVVAILLLLNRLSKPPQTAPPRAYTYAPLGSGGSRNARGGFFGYLRLAVVATAILAVAYLMIRCLSATQTLVAFVPWIALGLVVVLWFRRIARRGVEYTWQRQPQLQRPHVLEATVNGVIVSTAVSRGEYQWLAFTRFIDAPNLYLLYLSELTFHMIPKRAFASAEEVDAFRNMLRNLIASRPGGFPVGVPSATGAASESPVVASSSAPEVPMPH